MKKYFKLDTNKRIEFWSKELNTFHFNVSNSEIYLTKAKVRATMRSVWNSMIGKYFLNSKKYVRLELYQINLKEFFKRSQKVHYFTFQPSIFLKA